MRDIKFFKESYSIATNSTFSTSLSLDKPSINVVKSPFIAAILTIVGYSINDTIVIFDRIRENSKNMRRASAEEIADKSLTQTMSRSINTTLTTLITITAVNIFVPTVREFSFPLIIGIAVGAYSSIFIAAPTWVALRKRESKKVQNKIN